MPMKPLSIDSVVRTIDSVLSASDGRIQTVKDHQDWQALHAFNSSNLPSVQKETTPFFFGLQIRQGETVVGVVTFYLAYSTWDGRMLAVDCLEVTNTKDDELEQQRYLKILAQIAMALQCSRLIWTTTSKPSEWYTTSKNRPDVLDELLMLGMDRSAMESYASSLGTDSETLEKADDQAPTGSTQSSIQNCLAVIEETSQVEFRLRLSNAKDVDDIARLVQGLANFTKEPDAVNMTAEDYVVDGYSDEEPLFYCLLLEHPKDGGWYACGMAFFYLASTCRHGRFLYLEDLFIEEAYRKRGGGGLAMQSLAKLALTLNCNRFNWLALEWNKPALNLYAKIGAKIQEGAKIARYTGARLETFAKEC